MGVKVAVIGGGSTYTPELVDGLMTEERRLPIDELVLMDKDPERLETVAAFSRRILARGGWGGRLTATSDRAGALEGADFVIVQIRVGGQSARYLDETLPLPFDCIGQETTGPGGFAKALRTVPVVLELAEETARRAPGAWLIDFTNPTGIVTQALLDDGHRAIGLCNVAIGFQRQFAERYGVTPEKVELEHVGLNHLTWERAVKVDGREVLPELLQDSDELIAREAELPIELIRALGAIPSSYLHYYYSTGEVLERQRLRPSRAEEVMRIEAQLLEIYRDTSLDIKPKLLEERGGAFYSQAAVQLMASFYDDRGDVQVVNIRNDGALPNLPDDAVVEIPAQINRSGARGPELAPLAEDMLGLVEHAKAYERLTVGAATSGDPTLALKALMTNPLVGDYSKAAPLLKVLLESNRQHLPRFFPS